MAQIFISHIEEEQNIAEGIARGLEAAGYSTWYYERDSCPGADYLDQVDNAIDGCQVLLVVISPESIASRQIEKEVKWAFEKSKGLLPVLHAISWSEFQNRGIRLRMALGIAAAVTVPADGVLSIIPHIIKGLKNLGVEPNHLSSADQKSSASLPVSDKRVDLESTVSNPKYERDLRTLHRMYELRTIINPETVFFVVGGSIIPELLDRPLAELLRDQVDQNGGEYTFRRGIVITDKAWYAEAGLIAENPVIAIGGPLMNSLAHEFQTWTPPGESHEGTYKIEVAENATGFFRVTEQGVPQVGLWGANASGTRAAVLHYKDDPMGLQAFLKMCWPRD